MLSNMWKKIQGTWEEPLVEAARKGDTATVKKLLAEKISVTIDTDKLIVSTAILLSTALRAATLNNHADVVKQLLAAGASVDLPDEKGSTALEIALFKNNTEILSLLLAKETASGPIDDKGFLLKKAIRAGARECIQYLVTPESPKENLYTALLEAAVTDAKACSPTHSAVIELLLKEGASVNVIDSKPPNTTPLLNAVWGGCIETISQLLKADADVNIADKCGLTPLMRAAYVDNTGIIELLLSHQAKLEMSESMAGDTAFTFASRTGGLNAMKSLLKAGANIEHQDNSKNTSLTLVANFHNHQASEECTELLISMQANVNHQRHDEKTALMIAAKWSHYNVVDLLIKAGAIVNIQDNQGDTPLMVAARRRDHKMEDLLLAANAIVSLQNKKGATAQSLAGGSTYKNYLALRMKQEEACVSTHQLSDDQFQIWQIPIVREFLLFVSIENNLGLLDDFMHIICAYLLPPSQTKKETIENTIAESTRLKENVCSIIAAYLSASTLSPLLIYQTNLIRDLPRSPQRIDREKTILQIQETKTIGALSQLLSKKPHSTHSSWFFKSDSVYKAIFQKHLSLIEKETVKTRIPWPK